MVKLHAGVWRGNLWSLTSNACVEALLDTTGRVKATEMETASLIVSWLNPQR